MQRWTSHSEAETERVAARFAKTLHGGEVLLLSGELGAGKTVFVRGLARALGVHGRITSPTFVLMRVYRAASAKLQATSKRVREIPRLARLARDERNGIRHFVHVDAYRVHDPRELEAIGLSEWIGRPDTVVVIEWGERVARLLRARHRVTLAPNTQRRDARRIVIT